MAQDEAPVGFHAKSNNAGAGAQQKIIGPQSITIDNQIINQTNESSEIQPPVDQEVDCRPGGQPGSSNDNIEPPKEKNTSKWKWKKRYTVPAVLGVIVIIVAIVLGAVIPLGVRGALSSENGPSLDAPTSAFSSQASATPTHAQPSASPVASDPPPVPTTDGVYLCNYNNTVINAKGSLFAYYNTMSLEHNFGEQPDDVAFPARPGVDAHWEETINTAIFNSTNTNFTALVNVSAETVAGLPVNAVVGWAMNGNTNGEHLRNFTLYKHGPTPLYNDSTGSQFWPLYYAI